jgi:ribosomal protein S18 acetylase RimI-like enzyme
MTPPGTPARSRPGSSTSPDGFSIRQARRADLSPLVSLVVAEGDDGIAMRRRFTADLSRADRALFLAGAGAEMLGYGRVTHFAPGPEAPDNVAPEGYYMGGLLVASDQRRRGVGRALTGARLEWVFQRAPEAWYFANARNWGSLRLHAELGFIEITRDFVFPGVEFDGGGGVLARASRASGPGDPADRRPGGAAAGRVGALSRPARPADRGRRLPSQPMSERRPGR